MADQKLTKLANDLVPILRRKLGALEGSGGGVAAGGGGVTDHGALSGLGDNDHPQYLQEAAVQALIDDALDGFEATLGDTWQVAGSLATIDVLHAAGDSTLQILNSDATRKAHLQIEGDLTVLGTLYNTAEIAGQEWKWTTNEYMYISADYDGGDSLVQILNASASYQASLFVEDKITSGGDITAGGDVVGQTFRYPDTALYIEANNVLDSTIYVRNTDASAQASLNVEGDIIVGGLVDGIDLTALDTLVDAHIAATAAHGATGAVVGTTNSQTLSNKTLASPAVTGLMSAAAANFSGDVNVDAGLLFVDVSENRIGVMQGTPLYTLDVTGSLRATGNAIVGAALSVTGNLNVDNNVLYADAGTNRVGVRTTSLSYDLDVNGTFRAVGASVFNDGVSIEGDITLPGWALDAASGVLATTAPYAFVQGSPGVEAVGLRLQPAAGRIDLAEMAAARMFATTFVFDEVGVQTGDFHNAKSGGRTRAQADVYATKYLSTQDGKIIVTHDGKYLVARGTYQFDLDMEDPSSGHVQMMSAGDQIVIQGLATVRAAGALGGAGAFGVAEVKAVVNAVSDQTTHFRYTCTPYELDAYDHISFPAGTAVVVYGADGDAWVSLVANGSSAYLDIGVIRGSNWSDGLHTLLRLGDLSGLTAVAGAGEIGLAGGDIEDGLAQWTKLTEAGLYSQGGTTVITDDAGDAAVVLGPDGLAAAIESVSGSAGNRWDILTGEAVGRGSVAWVDDPADIGTIYGSVGVFQAQGYDFPGYTTEAHLAVRQSGAGANYSALAGLLAGSTGDSWVRVYEKTLSGVTTGWVQMQGVDLIKATVGSVYWSVLDDSIVLYTPNGSTANRIELDTREVLLDTNLVRIGGSLPTSSAGLTAGTLWRDGNTVKIA